MVRRIRFGKSQNKESTERFPPIPQPAEGQRNVVPARGLYFSAAGGCSAA